MATCVLGERSKNKLETIQLLNNIVKCRIWIFSRYGGGWYWDLKIQLLFSLLLDESTDMPGLAVLLVLALYLSQNKREEDLPSKCSVLKLVLFPEKVCTKLNFQGMWQQNLNIVRDWMSWPTREISCLSHSQLKRMCETSKQKHYLHW
jgi:hypothetical protein